MKREESQLENTLVLEPSTNTHTMKSRGKIVSRDLGEGMLVIETNGSAIVTHGEHGTLVTEAQKIVKYNQMEHNPVSKRMQNVYD